MSATERCPRGKTACLPWTVAGIAFAAALLATTTPARGEIIPASRMERGVTITPAQCAAHRTAVWVMVGQQGFCVRYYVSTVGGQGDSPVVYMSGDKLGIYNPRTRTFRPRPGKTTPDVDTNDLQKRADSMSRMAKTTAIYLARIGVDGTSGFHGDRRTWLELYMINAALDAIRKRHGYRGFHLVGQSGGGSLVGGLLAMRTDIGCAVPGAGMLAYSRGRPQGQARQQRFFNPIAGVPNIVRNRPGRIIVVTDPQDMTVPERNQTAFVEALRQAGYAVEQFFVETFDERRHGVTPYAIFVVSACVRNMTNQQIAVALAQYQKRYLAHMRDRQAGRRTAGMPATPGSSGQPPAPSSGGRGPAPQPTRYTQPPRYTQPSLRLPPVAAVSGPAGGGVQPRRY